MFISKRTLITASSLVVSILAFFMIGPWILDQLSPDPAEALDDLDFTFEFQPPIPEALGEPFAIDTNNCGSPVQTVETFQRSRDFSVPVGGCLRNVSPTAN